MVKKQSFRIIILLLIVFCNIDIYAQITVQSATGQNPNTLINNVLAGAGVELSDGEFNWSSGNISTAQIGTFTNGTTFTTFPFSSGIIMTTGNISVVPGANTEGGATVTVPNGGSTTRDAALQALVTQSLNSTTVLEFDFIAYSGSFEFEYVFASEEYPEYVCSSYNDVFAFFLTGMDPVTFATVTRNIAIVPNSITAANPNGLPVAINTVNPGVAGTSGSSGGCTSLAYSSLYNNNVGGQHMEFDGFTTALIAGSDVIACQPYHMKLSIANAGDNSFDSGVFLKEGSFYSPEIEIVNNFTYNDNDTLIKNCNFLDIEFHLESPQRAPITMEIYTDGTAVQGLDYEIRNNNGTLIPNGGSLSIADTAIFQRMKLSPLSTASFQPNEVKSINVIIVSTLCTYTPGANGPVQIYDTLHYFFIDNDSIELRASDTNYCNLCEHVGVELITGTEPLNYSWTPANPIITPNAIESDVHITQSTHFVVTATDRWNCLADTVEFDVNIVDKPDINVAINPENGCVPLTVSLSSNTTPDNSEHTWIISTGDTLDQVNASITIDSAGLYDVFLTVSSAPGCTDSLLIPGAIRVSDYPHASFSYAPLEPLNGRPINFYNESTGDNIVSYNYNFGDGGTSTLQNPEHAYNVSTGESFPVLLTVSNIDNCTDDTLQRIYVEDKFAFWVPNSFTPNNDDVNDIFLPKVRDVATYQLQIFNRFGEPVFSTTDPEIGWDGTYLNKKCPIGTYVWKITYISYSNLELDVIRTGKLNLLR